MITQNNLQRRALADLYHSYLDHQQAIKALLNESTPDQQLINSVMRQLASAEAIILKAYKKSLDS
jgi:hypothetical protein